MHDIINRAASCHVAMIDTTVDPPLPYVVPLNFGFEPAAGDKPDRFYLHGAREGRKLDLIRACNRVCVQLDVDQELVTGPLACDWGKRFASVIADGLAYIIDDEAERRLGLDSLMRHHDSLNGGRQDIQRSAEGSIVYTEKHLQATSVIRIDVTIMSAKLRS